MDSEGRMLLLETNGPAKDSVVVVLLLLLVFGLADCGRGRGSECMEDVRYSDGEGIRKGITGSGPSGVLARDEVRGR